MATSSASYDEDLLERLSKYAFDVDQIKDSSGPIFALDLLMYPDLAEKANFLTTKAIQLYNNENGTNYKGEKVLKVNMQFVAGFKFYITFAAKDDALGEQTFQALAYDHVAQDPMMGVRLCRLKGTKY